MKKKLIVFLLVFLFILLVAMAVYYSLPNKVAVLGYHGVTTDINANDDMQLYVGKFRKQMEYLKRHNYKTLTLEEMRCYMNNKCKIKKNTVLLTFDDGRLNTLENALPILKEYNYNAVLFIIGSHLYDDEDGYIKEKNLERIRKEYPNIEIASHSYNLHYHDAMLLSYEDYKNDFKEQEKWLDNKYYAYPYGDYNDDMIRVLRENNYELAFGFGPNKEFRKADNKDNKLIVPRLCINASMPMWKYKLRLLMPF